MTLTLKTGQTGPVRTLTLMLLATAAAGLTWAAQPAAPVQHHGHFKRMMHTGQTAGQVLLSTLPQAPGHWGVGATAGLRGEVVQLDGQLLVSPGDDPEGRLRPPLAGEEAVLFAAAPVKAWQQTEVPQDMAQPAFEAWLLDQARRAGLPADQAFVFRVQGRFPHLLWHVVTGEASVSRPTAAAQAPGGHAGAPTGVDGGARGDADAGAHGGTSSGTHANARAGLRLFRQPGASGQLVGVYSGAALEGVVSHPGERLHLHYVDKASRVSGHVDVVSVAAGSVLWLPVP